MINSLEYGKALYMLSAEEGLEERFLNELDIIGKLFGDNPEYVRLLDSPAVGGEEKHKLIDEVFSPFHLYISNFVKMLCDKRASYQLEECRRAFLQAYDMEAGVIRATAITAVAMSDSQKAALIKKLEKQSGKKVILENRVDSSVIGGVKLRYSGVQLDGTVSSRLDALRRALASATV